jgi:hypothetical protein
MGRRELGNFWNGTKNSKFEFHASIHTGWIGIGLLVAIFNFIFDPDYSNWPTFIEYITTLYFLYVAAAISFGILGIFFIYLGLLTQKDTSVYYTFFVLWILGNFLSRIYFGPSEKVIAYSFLGVWIIILVVSIMNRFNNMSRKIDEIHKKLNC